MDEGPTQGDAGAYGLTTHAPRKVPARPFGLAGFPDLRGLCTVMPWRRPSLRKDDYGTWSVIDIFTDCPAELGDDVMVLMDQEKADEMADLMNKLDRI